MLIQIGFDIAYEIPFATSIVYILRVHPSRRHDLLTTECLSTLPLLDPEEYQDHFGNLCGRLSVGPGVIRFLNHAIVQASDEPDPVFPEAKLHAINELPTDTLMFILPSRYCEVDSDLMTVAWENFAGISNGWQRVAKITEFVHEHVRFDYMQARATRTALETYQERVGVCRDFTHLAITLCRCMNIPARYVTGYLGDIGVPPAADPMDFSAWFEVYLGGTWHTFDARHNQRRIGRIVIGRGRDAGDVPISMVFGKHRLDTFRVITEEVSSMTSGLSGAVPR